MNLIPGSYESILTRRLQEALQGLDGEVNDQDVVDEADTNVIGIDPNF